MAITNVQSGPFIGVSAFTGSGGVSVAPTLSGTGTNSSSDEPQDPGSGYLWEDNFDEYASAPAMYSIGGCGVGDDAFGLPDSSVYGQRTIPNSDDGCNTNNDNMTLTTGRGGTGKALRSSIQSTGSQQNFTWITPFGPNEFDEYEGTIVIQFWFRVSSGGTPTTNGWKWLELFWSDQRVQWAMDRGTDERPVWSMVLGANPGGTVNRTPQPVGPWWDELNDGNWHRFTALYTPNTSTTYSWTGGGDTSATETYSGTSSRDGRLAAWVDGTKIMDYSQATVGVTPSGGLNQWCYQGDVDMIPADLGVYLKILDVVNGADGAAFTLDHDDLKVWVL